MKKMYRQHRHSFLFPTLIYLLGFFLLLSVFLASKATGHEMGTFLRDPAQIMGTHPYVGLVSNVGVMAWCATTIVCLFSFSLMSQKGSKEGQMLLVAGLYSGWLMLDDLFLMHEMLIPRLIGFSEKVTFFSYGVLLLIGLVFFRKQIRSSFRLPLMLALCFLFLSLVVDFFQKRLDPMLGDQRIMLEDGFKFIGILSWFLYFWLLSRDLIRWQGAPQPKNAAGN